MGWRTLGYASAVLYNAFLWLLWGRLGWRLADHSQFYLVPVGLSAVLFAEVNRRSLGREAVNAIRGVGMTLVYASLAFPASAIQDLQPAVGSGALPIMTVNFMGLTGPSGVLRISA